MIDKFQRSDKIKIKLEEFYESSQSYFDRLSKHNEKVFIPFIP